MRMTGLRTVSVRFPNASSSGESGLYSYFVPEGDEPCAGDVLMTSTDWSIFEPENVEICNRDLVKCEIGAKLARVVTVDAIPNPKATRFYMMLVPLDELKERHEANRELFNRSRAREAAKGKLDAMLEERGRLHLYEQMAKDMPEAAELLKALRGE